MRNTVTSILLLYNLSLTFCQEPNFKNQGEQENYQAKEFFKTEYKDSLYEKFIGPISIVDKNTLKFENKTLVVWGTSLDLLDIFKEGILYPQLLIGNERNTPVKTKTEISKLSDHDLFKYNTSRNDSLKMSDFEELDFLEHSLKQKRFRFWFYRQGWANPQVYFLELENKDANEETDLKTFIKGARLTFLKGAWIII